MFPDIDKKIARKKHPVESVMQKSLPQIYNALYPSANLMATEARLELVAEREDIRHWIAQHSRTSRMLTSRVSRGFGKISKNLKADSRYQFGFR